MSTTILARPAAGQRASIIPTPSVNISLGFDPAQATLERAGNDLNFTFDDGASISISGFYSDYTKDNVPDFEVDGTIVAGKDFFSVFAPDLMPAAGPSAATERSSRYIEHQGDSDLQGGLNHLDGLGSSTQSPATNESILQAEPLLTLGTSVANILSTPPNGGGQTPSPTADIRAVLYSAGTGSDSHFVSTPVFFKDPSGNLSAGADSVSFSFSSGWDSNWLEAPTFTNGQLVFQFSAAGLAQLQSLAPDAFLRGYVTVTVVKGGHTFEYVVEVVATNDSSFDSAAYDAQHGGVSRFGTESVGEYHQGSGQTGSYQITSSTGNDDIILNDSVIGGSNIHASGNPANMADDYNTILLNKGVNNQGGATNITSSDGKLVVHEGVQANGSNASNDINMGKGDIYIDNTSGSGLSATDAGVNTIFGGDIAISSIGFGWHVKGVGIYAEGTGSGNSITTENGNVAILGDSNGNLFGYGMDAKDSGTNSVTTENGNVTVSGIGQIARGMTASSGHNSITTKSGEVTVSGNGNQPYPPLRGYGMYADTSGSNSIITESGKIIISGNGSPEGHGMYAADFGSNSIATQTGDVSAFGETHGMGSTLFGSNSIATQSGNVTVSGSHYGMAVGGSGINRIDTESGSVTISMSDNGMGAISSGVNSIATKSGYVAISASDNGMYANTSGSNSIFSESGSIMVSSIAAFAYGIHAEDFGSQNSISTESGDVTVSAISNGGVNAFGMSAEYSGKNSITTANGQVTVTGNGSDNGYGMYAYYAGSNNSIATESGDVTVSGSSDNSGGYGIGMYTRESGSTNSITTESGDVTVSGTSNNSESYGIGMYTKGSGSSNSLLTENGNVNISGVSAAYGYGMHAKFSGSNSIIATGNGHVTVTGTGADNGYGMNASDSGSSNSIETNSGNVTVSGSMYGLFALSSGNNSIKTDSGAVNVSSRYVGMYANGAGSSNSIETNSGAVTVSGSNYGMWALDSSSNRIKTDSGNLTVSGTGSYGYGLYVNGSGSSNNIETNSGAVNVSSRYIGMYANVSGNNSITTQSGNVTVSGTSTSEAAYGMFAVNYGNNSIKTDSGAVNVSGTYGMYANSSGSSNSIETNNGAVNVSGVGSGMFAYSVGGSNNNSIKTDSGAVNVSGAGSGMSASYSGSNSIKTGSGVVTVSSSDVGMSANSSGNNSIKTDSSAVNVSGTNANFGYGMSASYFGSNSITTESGAVTVSGTGNNYCGYGMYANGSGSSNSITTESGAVTISGAGTNSHGMYANISGSNSIRTDNGTVDLSATGTTASGMAVAGVSGTGALVSGSNSITSGGKTTITANTTGSSADANAYGMVINYNTGVSGDASNSITSGDGVVIKSFSNTGNAYGMAVLSSGSATARAANTINASGNIEITAESKGTAAAMYATGAHAANNIVAEDGTVSLSATSTSSAGYGMFANASGSNNIRTEIGDVKVTATSDGKNGAYGMNAANSGSNHIETVSGDVTVTGFCTYSGSGYSYGCGMSASSSGSNSIISDTGNIYVAGERTAASGSSSTLGIGMYAISSGCNSVTTTSGTVTIVSGNFSPAIFASGIGSMNTVVASSDGKVIVNAYYEALSAHNGGNNVITGGDISIAAKGSTAFWASDSGSKNFVNAGTDGNVTVSGGYAGMRADRLGINSIAGKDITVIGQDGITTWNYGQNIIRSESGSVSISTSRSDGVGMRASLFGSNSLTTIDGDVTVTGRIGMNAISSGSNNIFTKTGKVTISGNSNTSAIRGMYAADSGNNSITTESGAVTVSANGTGMYANTFGNNSITTESGDVNVTGTGNTSAYGMQAENSGSNSISSTDGAPLTVTITASASAAENAIAMWANGGGSVNYITGHSQAGGIIGDSITLNGGVAMQSTNGGRNVITTGAGNDSVSINGAVKGSGNEIYLGEGSNTVTLNGAIESGSLNIIATGGGTYTLILQASSPAGFVSRYGAWLNAITSDSPIASHISSIKFDGLDHNSLPSDFLAAFKNLLNDLHDNNVDIQPPDLWYALNPPSPTAAPVSMMFMAADAAVGSDSSHTTTDHAGQSVTSIDSQDAQVSGIAADQSHNAQIPDGSHISGEAEHTTAGADSQSTDAHSQPDGDLHEAAANTLHDVESAQASAHDDAFAHVEHDDTPLFAHLSDNQPTTTDLPHDTHSDLPDGNALTPNGEIHADEGTISATQPDQGDFQFCAHQDDLEGSPLFAHLDELDIGYGGRAPEENIALHHDDAAANITWEYGAITLTDGNETVDCLFTESSPLSHEGSTSDHLYGESLSSIINASLTDIAVASDMPEVSMEDLHSTPIGAVDIAATNNVQTFETADVLQEATDMAVRQLEQG